MTDYGMKRELRYVELKTGYSDNGPAWIGYAEFSKSGRALYFDGKVLKKGNGITGNHFDLKTGEEYWVSGVKKNGADRHDAGGGDIGIDRSAIEEYLHAIGSSVLPKSLRLVQLNNSPAKDFALGIENRTARDGFDHSLRFKPLNELSDEELNALVGYYDRLDIPSKPKKSRKDWVESKNDALSEQERRGTQAG